MLYLSTGTKLPLFINPDFTFDFDFDAVENMPIPKGFELVEKEDHKKQRLEKERETLTARKKMLLGLLDEIDARFNEIKKELE